MFCSYAPDVIYFAKKENNKPYLNLHKVLIAAILDLLNTVN